MPQHRAEARALGKLRVGIADEGHVRERVGALAVRARLLANEPPLLHVAQVIVTDVLVALEHLPSRDRRCTGRHHVTQYNPPMLLAGDVGGTKTLLGLFDEARPRPRLITRRSYETNAFDSFTGILDSFARDVGLSFPVSAAAAGVAGPVIGDRAVLTNIDWDISSREIAERCATTGVRLLNDLEAIANSVEVLTSDELVVLQEGVSRPDGNAVVIAAGTGLGEAYLHRVNGRLQPVASEGGHADWAARTDPEIGLLLMLRSEYGRAEVEYVLSGPGLRNIHRSTHHGQDCDAVRGVPPDQRASRHLAGGTGRHVPVVR